METPDFNNPQNIQAIVQRRPYSMQVWSDVNVEKRKQYTYAITALDRLHNESSPSLFLHIKTRGRKGKIKIE
jgi:hypothetical protein